MIYEDHNRISADLAAAVHRQSRLQSCARASLARIAQESGDNATLSVASGFDVVCISREQGSYPIRACYLTEGRRLPMGVGSPGLAYLSALPMAEAEAIFHANAACIRRQGPLEPQALRKARECGYAVSSNVVFEGTGGISVPIVGSDARPMAVITVSAIVNRLASREQWLGGLLQREAAVIASAVARLDRLLDR